MKLRKMRNETIDFNESRAIASNVPIETPPILFTIGDKVAVDNGSQPEGWNTGVIVGLHLRVYSHCSPIWNYCIHFDSPIGTQEWFGEDDSSSIYPASSIPDLEKAWERENIEHQYVLIRDGQIADCKEMTEAEYETAVLSAPWHKLTIHCQQNIFKGKVNFTVQGTKNDN